MAGLKVSPVREEISLRHVVSDALPPPLLLVVKADGIIVVLGGDRGGAAVCVYGQIALLGLGQLHGQLMFQIFLLAFVIECRQMEDRALIQIFLHRADDQLQLGIGGRQRDGCVDQGEKFLAADVAVEVECGFGGVFVEKGVDSSAFEQLCDLVVVVDESRVEEP